MQNENSPVRSRYPVIKWMLMAGLLAVLLAAVYAGYLYFKLDQMMGKISVYQSDDNHEYAPKPQVILFLGLDTREETRSLNTDVIMVASLNPQTKSAAVLSLPRDIYMKPDGYKERKANAFYSIAVRQDKEPPEQLIKKLFGEFLGIPIDYVVIVNFKAFEDIIDQLGGIKVDVDMDMCYIDNADGTHIQLQKGTQVLSGKDSLDFIRYRHSTSKCAKPTAESSDYERNQRQHLVLSAILDRLTSIGGFIRLGSVFDAVSNNLKIDMPQTHMKSFFMAYATMKKENIEFIALQGQWRSPYIWVNDQDFENAVQKLKTLNAE